ncbi:NAD/FAD-binding protein [Devosia pacifica]|uniref:NAD/FAD-binding protein n=1 Tax=Devosia pacifica TaxID=1335967 RepID=A0A918SG84_9HYPH|nr:FAD-dependent oxidoreductase [Devosia pacifica]GHA36891.1 NAD/FAD-binding protein [Devosia pacifica]
MAPLDIAVIGSGITGLSTAWLLSRTQNVTLLERASKLGGHTNTVSAKTGDGAVDVDTGFIVFNEANYPNLTALLAHLGVETAVSSMSFAVSVAEGRMEYCGRYLNGLFGQRRNLIRVEHWRLVSDILRFFREARKQIDSCPDDLSIGAFLERYGYSKAFIEDHILPISAAIWSTPSRGMLAFPARTFIEFFDNHNLLQVNGRPIWRTVKGGAQRYIDSICADGAFQSRTDVSISRVRRQANAVEIDYADGSTQSFDEVVFACHADQAMEMIADPTEAEREVLSSFKFTANRAVLHTDKNHMPRQRNLWSSWNYLRASEGESALSLTYWMNKLQPLDTKTNIFVTLNPSAEFAPGTVQQTFEYDHPLFDAAAIEAQRDLWRIQGQCRTWFAGAWMGYGFHEDGLQAGLEVAERIGGRSRPWSVPAHRDRIAHTWVEDLGSTWAAE